MDMLSYVWSFANYKIGERFKYLFSSEEVLAKTSYGPVKGFKTTASTFGYQYISFQGIPYAKPPVNELRFKDPVPPDPWTEPPTEFVNGGSTAWQKDMIFGRQAGNENCLHLSVYTKDIEPKNLCPVMVWIHGGAFVLGNNAKEMYNPELLMQKDIVLIAINYRLGALGFLSLADPALEVPGNAGLKDQVLALKWVKENCVNFGGDPNNITLFGESAGGASTHFHMVSEMSSGLFHKAIAMSGTIYSPWALTHIQNWGERLARALGWNGEGGERAALELLSKVSPQAIIRQQEKLLTLEERKNYILFEFGPIVEPYVSKQCFFPQHPTILARNCWSKNVPMLIGSCSDEGLLFYKIAMKKPSYMAKLKLEYLAPLIELGLDVETENSIKLGNQVRNFYFGFTDVRPENILTYLMVLSDKHFLHGVHRSVLSRTNAPDAGPTYVYRFNFESVSMGFVKNLFAGKHIPGTCHGDDLSYLFKPAFIGKVPSKNSREFKMIEEMCSTFVAFATTGSPNNETIGHVQWEPVKKPAVDSKTNTANYKCLNFSDEITFIDLPEAKRMKLWDEMYKDNGKDLI